MSPWLLLLMAWLLAALMMGIGWQWQRRHANASNVDVLWAAGLGGAALLTAALGQGAPVPRVMLGLTAGIWSLRLAAHLWRRMHGAQEDGRYRALRERWGDDQHKWFGMFQFQALLIPLFALPFIAVAFNPTTRPLAFAAGSVVWLVAILGEWVADRQLARFRTAPEHEGTTCRTGLWRYSRHPNYFFEWLHWFAYVLLAVGSPLGWLAWTGPAVMFLFLRFVSGIPFAEQQALRTRGEDYRAYQRETSMLVPWFPKISHSARRSAP